MENRLKRVSTRTIIMIVAGLYGAIIFCMIYGVKILNPTYDDWLYTGGDMTQHYMGWLFYRRSDWHFPFGLVDSVLGDTLYSCMYTDSIPLFALFFKILSPVLPSTFQYFGLWGIFCFAMSGAFSSLLIYKFNKNPVFCIIASTIYVLCPAVLHRMYGHESLAGHFIIILALVLWAYQNHQWKKAWMQKLMPAILWGLLGIITVYTHIYFLPMIYCILLASVITDIGKHKKIFRPVSSFISVTAFSLIALAVIGAFYGDGSQAAVGLGMTSANLNTFWNGMEVGGLNIFAGEVARGSKYLKAPASDYWQFEGFAYLGLGVLIAVLISIVIVLVHCIVKKDKFFGNLKNIFIKYKWYMIAFLAAFVAALFFAVSPKCTFNDKVIYEIHYPQKIEEILSIFRASGRFAWVCDYLIFTGVLFVISKINKKIISTVILAICVCIQTADLSDMIASKAWFKETKTYVSPLLDPRWDEFAIGSEHMVILPYDIPSTTSYALGKLAYDYGLTMNHFQVARPPIDDIIQAYFDTINLIAEGNGDPYTLYVFLDKQYIPESVDNLEMYDLDGYTVVRCNQQQ